MYYVLLAGLAALAAAVAFRRTERKAALVAAYVFSMAVIMVADWIAWGIFRLYEYRPGLSASPLVDAAWGELLGDILFVPGVAVALLSLGSPLWTALLGTLLFTGIEHLFIRVGLFTLTGWMTWMTIAAFPFYFSGVWRFHRAALSRGLQGRWMTLVIRTALLTCILAILSLWLRAAQTTEMAINLLPTFLQNQSLGRFLLSLLLPVAMGHWVMAGARHSRLLAATFGLTLLNYVLSGSGLQLFKPPWTEMVDGVAQGLCIGIACMLEAWLLQLQQTEKRPTFIR